LEHTLGSLDRQRLCKIDAATQQVEAAIELFYGRRYAPAITLAGAAEGCISGTLGDDAREPLFELMKRGVRERYDMNSKEAVARFNAVLYWLKHETKDAPGECQITDFDAWSMIVRAVTKLNAIAPKSETPAIARFIEFSREHYASAMAGQAPR
jgi:hypothetical protein